jgi:hypothetical protein
LEVKEYWESKVETKEGKESRGGGRKITESKELRSLRTIIKKSS